MSSLNSLRLFVDVHNKRLVKSPYDSSAPTLPALIKDDKINIEVYPLMPSSQRGFAGQFEPITSTTLFTTARFNLGDLTSGAETKYLGNTDPTLTAEQKLFDCSVLAGGNAYYVGDILKVTNGTQVEAAKVIVTSVDDNSVTSVEIYDEGAHTSGVVQPATGRPTTVFAATNSAGASGLTLYARFAQTFVGLMDLTVAALDDNLLTGTSATTLLEVRLENGLSAGDFRVDTILQQEVTVKEDVMDV